MFANSLNLNLDQAIKLDQAELEQAIKRHLRKNNMLGRQASDERFYMKIKVGGRGLESLREVYEQTRLRVCLCQIDGSRKDGNKKQKKECNAIKDEIILTMQIKGKREQFEGEDMKLEGKVLYRESKPIRKDSNSTEKRKCKVK